MHIALISRCHMTDAPIQTPRVAIYQKKKEKFSVLIAFFKNII